MRTIFVTILMMSGFLMQANGQKLKRFDEKNVQVNWQLIANSYKQSTDAFCAFTIVNNSKTSFPASGWAIYFTSNSDIATTTSPAGLTVTHINGDIFKLFPAAGFKGLKTKDSARIEYNSPGLLINRSLAPSALYIVWDNDPTNGFTLTNYTVGSLQNATIGLVTPEKIYQQNSIIKDIPAAELPKIFPTPASYKETGGTFLLVADVSVQADADFQKEAAFLSQALKSLAGKKPLVVGDAGANKIMLKKEAMANEAYTLSVTSTGIVITAGSGAGIFYGIQSLRSLILPGTAGASPGTFLIPTVEVQDAPRFGFRSLMIDVARNFQPKPEILKTLDLMAQYKMNALHLHFSDDEGWRIEIPSLPELTTIGAQRGHSLDSKTMLPASYGTGPVAGKGAGSGYYTRNDFIEILKYAKERYIEVIPEIESPGHGRAAIKAMDARYEKLMQAGNKAEAERYLLRDINDQSVYSSAQMWTDNVMCVALPSVYTFMDKVTDELIAMYKEAGAPLHTIHMGGDEVPGGVWEKSPVSLQLLKTNPELKEINDLWYYYYTTVNKMLQAKGLFMSGWEEAGMRKTMLDGEKTLIVNPRMANDNIRLHVWNNMVGWGNEDLPYRLANAGYKVVLSCVSNNYLDLSYFKSPDEPGYYWGGFQDIDKPFYFNPYDYYKTSKEDAAGNPVDPSYFKGKDRLTEFGKSNIAGVQGLLWAENIRSTQARDYMLLPKALAVAERAWASDPEWAVTKDNTKFTALYNEAWSVFANVIGKRELPRLDELAGGFNYRIPTVGAMVENGTVVANVQLPGLTIRYTSDGTEPTVKSNLYTGPVAEKGTIRLKVFNGKGRSSRTISVENK
jgi:hexosaminidase